MSSIIPPEQLKRARQLMSDKTVSISEITRRTHISRQTLYNHFPNLKIRHPNQPLLSYPTKIEVAKATLDSGVPISGVVKALHVGQDTLYRHIPGLKGARRVGASGTPEEKIEEMRRLLATTRMTVKEICAEVGISGSTLNRYVPEAKGTIGRMLFRRRYMQSLAAQRAGS